MEATYLAASTILLAFVACIWRSAGLANILIKFGYLLVSVAGCILCAKEFLL